ncbi:hypothetical protein Tco_0901332 [Tanacetum coccineum]
MSQPANDDFSQHLSDDEASYHEDASENGTATNKPKQQQQQLKVKIEENGRQENSTNGIIEFQSILQRFPDAGCEMIVMIRDNGY